MPRLVKKQHATGLRGVPGTIGSTSPAAETHEPRSVPNALTPGEASRPDVPAPTTYRCPAKGCEARSRQKGYFCDEHWASFRAKRYHGDDDAGVLHLCIVPGCRVTVPHRDFICPTHWAKLDSRRQWKIKHYATLYRVFLGMARDEAQEPTVKASTE